MSDENEAAQIDAEPPTPPPEGDSASADASEVTLDSEHADSAKPRSRDAKTRLELRETKTRLERMQRAEAERIARDHLADPTDMWVAGVSVNDLLDERGDLDTEKITATVEQLIEAHPTGGHTTRAAEDPPRTAIRRQPHHAAHADVMGQRFTPAGLESGQRAAGLNGQVRPAGAAAQEGTGRTGPAIPIDALLKGTP